MALKSVTGGPACGFMVQSHDEKASTEAMIAHAKNAHSKDVKPKDVKGMMNIGLAKKSKKR